MEARERTQDGNGSKKSGDGEGSGTGREQARGRRRENERKTGTGTGTGAEMGTGTRMEKEGGEQNSSAIRHTSKKKQSRRPGTAIPRVASSLLCRHEVAPAGGQQLREKDLAPLSDCGTQGKTWHQGRDGGNGDGNRDGDGDGNENEDGNGHEARDGGRNGSENDNEYGEESGGKRAREPTKI